MIDNSKEKDKRNTVYSKRNAHLIRNFFVAPPGGGGAKNLYARLHNWELYTCSIFAIKKSATVLKIF